LKIVSRKNSLWNHHIQRDNPSQLFYKRRNFILKPHPFKASGKVETNKGWKILFSQDVEDDTEKTDSPNLPQVEKGETGKGKLEVKQGKTTPPKPYTEGQIIDAMKTAGKTLENDDEKEI